ncbi:MAG TPA: aminotransferase class I/II-fold pyridoxal phosphate-dependent enzyme, partial [Microbacteriaceae bacterium]
AGCRSLIAEIVGVRKNLGLILPTPVQAAMIAALGDDEHVRAQREVYRRRRAKLRPAFESAGFRVDASEAGLYLWATRGEDAWETVSTMAEAGILVVPGTFYGEESSQHVRLALTVSDERVEAALSRLADFSN